MSPLHLHRRRFECAHLTARDAFPGPFQTPLFNTITQQPMPATLHPMKGPMVTQSLRGMQNHGPMHWRGDRTGGNDAPSAQPDSGSFDERAAFRKFQAAFASLLGRSGPIPDDDMEAFTDFILQVTYPPNPIRNLDNSLTPDQAAGRDFFQNGGHVFDNNRCGQCHVLDPNANPGSPRPGFFGTRGFSSFDFENQLFKIPHLRNVYQKIGKFGMPLVPTGVPQLPFIFLPFDNDDMGDQVRGYGFIHDGTLDTPFRFFHGVGFSTDLPGNTEGIPPGPEGDVIRRQIEAFLFAFDSNLAPIVGQQITLTHANAAVAGPRVDLLMARADVGECDLVAKGRVGLAEVGFFYVGGGQFLADRQAAPPVSDAVIRQLVHVTGDEVTYTCTPPGSGERIGVDRDGDGFFDGDEIDAGSDPADPASTP